ncbi:MAG: TonB-dependent receptor, partial [Pseudomonadota bacterium]
ELDDYEIQRFSADNMDDSFHNTSWTLEGRLGMLEALYTGAYTDRTTDQRVDYTDYLFVAQYLPYYICDASVTYPGSAGPLGTCQAPDLFVDSSTETKVQTHELRFNTPKENRLRATFGGFYSDLELAELNKFVYPGSEFIIGFDGVSTGFAPNYPLTNTAVTGEINNASPGYFSDPGPFPTGEIFRNDILRTDQQLGIFGEATYDISDQFAVTFGARWYEIEVDFEGSANSSFFNLGATTDAQQFGANISEQFSGSSATGAPDTATTDGVIIKATGQWTPTDDMLFYATYSEGFRPGFLNRPGGVSNAAGTYTVPFSFDTDEVKNYELGWKTELFNNSLRFNGSAFFVDIENLQINVFDPTITNLFFSDNAANAETRGLEGEFTWLPQGIEGLTIAGAFSFLDTEVTEVLIDSTFVEEGAELAFAPAYQGSLRARYEWELKHQIAEQDLLAHIMPQVIFSDSANIDVVTVKNFELDAWTSLGLTAGVTGDNWTAELYATNLTNEYAELSGNQTFDRPRVTPMRPRTVGLRVGYDF